MYLVGNIVAAIRSWQAERSSPLVVGIDGHGASGKSTIAAQVARELDATLVHTDEFFHQPGPGADGLAISSYYDWARLRTDVLEPLRSGRRAEFRAHDASRPQLEQYVAVAEPRDLILLEGVSACAPELADLVDRSILVETPEAERLERLKLIIPTGAWDEQWLAAERAYLSTRGRAFDLVVSGSGVAGSGASAEQNGDPA